MEWQSRMDVTIWRIGDCLSLKMCRFNESWYYGGNRKTMHPIIFWRLTCWINKWVWLKNGCYARLNETFSFWKGRWISKYWAFRYLSSGPEIYLCPYLRTEHMKLTTGYCWTQCSCHMWCGLQKIQGTYWKLTWLILLIEVFCIPSSLRTVLADQPCPGSAVDELKF